MVTMHRQIVGYFFYILYIFYYVVMLSSVLHTKGRLSAAFFYFTSLL